MSLSRELREQYGSIQARMQEIVDAAEVENRNLTPAEAAEFTRCTTDQTDLRARITRQDALETSVGGVPFPMASDSELRSSLMNPSGPITSDAVEHARIINAYFRQGRSDMQPEDRRMLGNYLNVLQTTSGGAGGYLVPPAFRAGVVEAMKAYGGMRQVASVITTAEGQDLPFATNDDTGNVGEILAEGATASVLDASFGVRILKAHMFSSKVVRVSFQLLNDSAFPIDAFLTRIFATRIGRITNTYFTTGAGANEPSGILTDSTLGVTAAATGAVTYDEILDLIHSVDPVYRVGPGVGFMFHDTTLRELRQLKDGNGLPLWSDGTKAGEPSSLAGYGYTINQDMPTMATGNKSIVFGDMSAYYIRDVDQFSVLRLEELYATSAQVGFLAFSRHDGGLIDAGQNPVKHLVQA